MPDYPPTTLEHIQAAFEYIDPEPRDTWLACGMAVHSFDQSEACFSIWDKWSSFASTYDAKDCAYQWAHFKQNGNGKALGIGTFFKLAKDGGYKKGETKPVEAGIRNEHLKTVQKSAPKKLWDSWEEAELIYNSLPSARDDTGAVAFFLSEYGLTKENIPPDWVVFDHPSKGRGVVYVGNTTDKKFVFKFKSIARDPERRKRRMELIHGEGLGALAPIIPNRPLVITGGEEKAIAAYVAGYSAFTTLAGEASLGDWPAYIAGGRFSKIILAMDFDEAGGKAALSWSSDLLAAGASPLSLYRVQWPANAVSGYDLNDALKNGSIVGLLEGATCEARAGSLSIFSPDEMFATKFEDNDQILDDRLLSIGGAMSVLGPGGIGKSRIVTQMLISIILGREWLGIKTFKPDARVLIFQTENSLRRLTKDMGDAMRGMGDHDRNRINTALHVLAPINDDDSFVSMADEGAIKRLMRAVDIYRPDIVVADPFGDFFGGDNENDAVQMRDSFRRLKKIAQSKNRDCALIIVHHARTGKAAAAGAVGIESANFGRGSKALHSCVRSQINVAPGSDDDDSLLVVACGKNNDGRRFDTFGVKLNRDTMIYDTNYDFCPHEWRERMESKRRGRPTAAKRASLIEAFRSVDKSGMRSSELVSLLISRYDISESTAKRWISDGLESKQLARIAGVYSIV